MRNTLLGAAVLAMTLVSGAATAQPYGGYDRGGYGAGHRDSDRDGRSDRREWIRDRDRDGRVDQYDRRDGRRGQAYQARQHRYYGGQHGYSGYRGHWRSGQRYPHYNQSRYFINDYSAYRLPPPHRGYRYYREDNGDVVMAAIATGVIAMIIGGALSDQGDRYGY